MEKTVITTGDGYYIGIDIGSTPEEILAVRGDYPDNQMGNALRDRGVFKLADNLVRGIPDFDNTGEFLQALSSFTDLAPCATRQVFGQRTMSDGNVKHYPPQQIENELTAEPGHPCNLAHIEYQRSRGGDVSDARNLLNVQVDDEGRAIKTVRYFGETVVGPQKVRDNGSWFPRPQTGEEVKAAFQDAVDSGELTSDELEIWASRADENYALWESAAWEMGPTDAERAAAQDTIRDFAARLTYWISQT